MTDLRRGLAVPCFAEDPAELIELGTQAERAGFDGFFLWDHLVFADDGMGPPIVDPWQVLAVVAARTARIRIGTMVTPLPRRRPWQLAKETTTLDRLSSGRLILGVGVGSPAHADFGLFGEPVGDRDRADLLDEGLDALALLWSGEVVSLRGRHFQFGPVRLLPRPVQRPRIPVWVAGILPAAKPLARAARWDGFVPIHRGRPAGLPSPEDIAAARRRIEQQRSTADGFDIAVWASLNSGGDGPRPDRSAYADAGATWWLDTVRAEPGWPELAWAQVQRA